MEIEIRLPSRVGFIDAAVTFFESTISPTVNDPMQCKRLGTCLREALINAILHGNLEINFPPQDRTMSAIFDPLVAEREALPEFGDRNVTIHWQILSDRIEFSVTDEGKGFTYPDSLPKPENLAPSGRGLILIQNVVDSVGWNQSGTQITMIKHLSGGEA